MNITKLINKEKRALPSISKLVENKTEYTYQQQEELISYIMKQDKSQKLIMMMTTRVFQGMINKS